MNEVEEYYIQHFGVKGMKWGVRKKRNPAQKAQRKAEKKTQKALYKEAKGDIKKVARAQNSRSKERISAATQNIHGKRLSKQGYNEAFNKAGKSYKRQRTALNAVALTSATLYVVSNNYPGAITKGASVLSSAVGNTASATGMYAKYAAKAAVPVSRTVKNRGIIDAVVANGSNLARYAG